MKAERLFQILGLVDESLIEEADTASSRRCTAAALMGSAFGRGRMSRGDLRRGVGTVAINLGAGTGSPGDAALAGGESGGDGHSPGTTFLSYAGPVFPLTTAETNTRLTAGRTVTWDFAPAL
ncbi:MAG: hypothetical protein ACLTYN_01200 [Dysosmobacter welbionis]